MASGDLASHDRAVDGRGDVAVLGAGGHAKVVISTLREAGWNVACAYDDDRAKWGTRVNGVQIVGGDDLLASGPQRAVIAIGNNRTRQKLAARHASLEWVTVVHPRAWVDPTVRLGAGTVVFAGAVIQAETMVGSHVIINTAATVDHDSVIGDFVHIAPGCHLAGEVRVDEGAFLGIGASVIVGVEVGPWSVVGAGGVAVRHVPPGVTAVGVPARPKDRR